MNRRKWMQVCAVLAVPFDAARAQDYPRRPIRWIVPYPAGGAVDVVGRKLAEFAAPRMGQPIVVENRPGANGSIGIAEVVRAPADGYTFGIVIPDSVISVASLLKAPPYDARSDLFPLAKVASGTPVVLANVQSGIRSMADLVQAAERQPGRLSYGSWGQGTLPHLAMSCIERQARVRMVHVPYKGLQPATTDLVADAIQVTVGSAGLARPYVEKGLIVPIGTLGPERSPYFREVPTLAEAGFADEFLRNGIWTGIVAPKGLPADLARRWTDTLGAIVASAEYASFLDSLGQRAIMRGPEDFSRELLREWTVTNDLIRSLGIVPG